MKISETLTTYGLCIENEFLEAYETLIKLRQTCSVWKASDEKKTKKRRNKNEVKKIPVSELIEHLESGWNYGKGEN